jgi:hypothetical protein
VRRERLLITATDRSQWLGAAILPHLIWPAQEKRWASSRVVKELAAQPSHGGRSREFPGTVDDLSTVRTAAKDVVRKLQSEGLGCVQHILQLLRLRRWEMALVEAGVIPTLLKRLQGEHTLGTGSSTSDVLSIMCRLSANSAQRAIIAGSTGVNEIVVLHLRKEPSVAVQAARLISVLAIDTEVGCAIGRAGAIPALAELLQAPAADVQLAAVCAITSLFLDNSVGSTVEFIDAVAALLVLLDRGTLQVRIAAAGALGNACGINQERRLMVDLKAIIPVLVNLLREDAPQAVENVAAVLNNITKDEDSVKTIASHPEAMSLLVKVLERGTLPSKIAVAGALQNMSDGGDVEIHGQIAAAGAIPLLVQLLSDRTTELIARAVAALGNLCYYIAHRRHIAADRAVFPLIRLLFEGFVDTARPLSRLVKLDDCRDAMIDCGAVELLVALLDKDSEDALLYAAVTLETIATTAKGRNALVSAGAVRLFMLVASKRPACDVALASVGALHNIATAPEHRHTILASQALPVLVTILEVGSEKAKEMSARTLRFFVSDMFRENIETSRVIPPLILLLNSGSQDCRIQAALVLSGLSKEVACKMMMTSAGAIPLLLPLLGSDVEAGREAAASALAHIASYEGAHRVLRETGAIPLLVNLSRTGAQPVSRYASYALVFLARDDMNSRTIADLQTIPDLIRSIGEGNAGAAINLATLARHSTEIQLLIVREGAIPPLVRMLTGRANDKGAAANALANLAGPIENFRTVASAGAIPLLISVLRDQPHYARVNAALALGELAHDGANSGVVGAGGAIPLLVQLFLDDASTWSIVASALCRIAGTVDEVMMAFAAAAPRGIELLLGMLSEGTPRGKENVAMALRCMPRELRNTDSEILEVLLPLLVHQLHDGTEHAKLYTAEILSDLADDGRHCAAITAAGAIASLASIVLEYGSTASVPAVGALANLAGDAEAAAHMIAADHVTLFVQSLHQGAHDRKKYAAKALAHLTMISDVRQRPAVVGAIPDLTQLLQGGTQSAREAAARTLRNISLSVDLHDRIIDADAIPRLVLLLAEGGDCEQEAAASTLMHLTEDSYRAQKATFDAGAMPRLLQMKKEGTPAIRGAATGVLANLAVLLHDPVRKDTAEARPELIE